MSASRKPLRPHGEFLIRYASSLNRSVRVHMQTERDALLTSLTQLDDELQELSAKRREILRNLGDLRDRLWPRVDWCHGRRPPRDDQPPLPPLNDDTTVLSGRPLRNACSRSSVVTAAYDSMNCTACCTSTGTPWRVLSP